jgi:CheY-like chemotaxis protein
MTLLIVDDNAAVRRMIPELSSTWSRRFASAQMARERLLRRNLHPGVVLMDLEMRGVDGITATRQILSTLPDAKLSSLVTAMSSCGWGHEKPERAATC